MQHAVEHLDIDAPFLGTADISENIGNQEETFTSGEWNESYVHSTVDGAVSADVNGVRRDSSSVRVTGSTPSSTTQEDPLWTLDRAPCDLETTMPGVMPAGEVRSGITKRCGFAVGDGSTAVTFVHRYLGELY